jgi:hypothetical protein
MDVHNLLEIQQVFININFKSEYQLFYKLNSIFDLSK